MQCHSHGVALVDVLGLQVQNWSRAADREAARVLQAIRLQAIDMLAFNILALPRRSLAGLLSSWGLQSGRA